MTFRPIFRTFARLASLASCLGVLAAAAHAAPLSSLEYLEDPGHTLDVVKLRSETRNWTPITGSQPDFGLSASRFWIRGKATIPPGGAGRWYLWIDNPFLDRMTVYVGGSSAGNSGALIPLSRRLLTISDNVVPLDLPEGVTSLTISVEGYLALFLPIKLLSSDEFAQHHGLDRLITGLFLGFLLFCGVSCVIIGYYARSRIVYLYSAYIAMMVVFYYSLSGVAGEHFWPDWTDHARTVLLVSGGLAFVLYLAFSRGFIDSKKLTPKLDKIALLLIYVSIARAFVIPFYLTPNFAASGGILMILGNVLASVMGAVCWRRSRNARFLLVASLAFNISVIIYGLQCSGFLFITSDIDYIGYAGTSIEIIFLGAGLFDQLRRLNETTRRQKIAALKAEKLSLLGRMAAGIVHEINNPLTVIQGQADLLKLQSSKAVLNNEKVLVAASAITDMVQRMTRIITGVRSFARFSGSEPFEAVPLADIVSDSINLCRPRLRSSGIVLADPTIPADAQVVSRQIECTQVLVNLLNNAADAVDSAHVKKVAIEITDLGELYEIAVVDSGPGIPENIRSRVFDAFYTSKDPGKGTGLGLSISKEIVEAHGGTIRIDESSPETRLAFTLRKV